GDRAAIAGALIESLHGESEPGVEAAWETEIKKRVMELDAHTVKTVPWSEVRERLFRGFE
ncbi:MAG TPA: addiction module protein, partial [Gammaproteobacteria bacterium]|nr:addiction module protein [Gammaproteobacteria bacterium]